MDAPANPAQAALEGLIDRLHERGRLRVWSLVITVLGDAVVPRGGRVALATLQEIMEQLRIEPGALRTAMSRLAKDHWVAREREGRNSFFRLDEQGRHAFDLATRRIYAPGPPEWDGQWTVAVAPRGASGVAGDELAALGFVKAGGGAFLRPETREAPDAREALSGMLVVHGESAEHPEAFRALWPSDEIAGAYHAFLADLRPLGSAVGAGAVLSPLDAMAARTLLIHHWRRIVLRDPGLPRALMPRDWPGEEARALVRETYAALLGASEGWLDAAGVPPPLDAEALRRRFGRDGS